MVCDMPHALKGRKLFICTLVILFCAEIKANAPCLFISNPDITLLYTDKAYFSIIVNTPIQNESSIVINVNHDKVLSLDKTVIPLHPNMSSNTWNITITGKHPGNAILTATLNPAQQCIQSSAIHVAVEKDLRLGIASDVIGWIYFTAWTVSFYPQIYTNYKKKSVIGLNFDFLGLNIIGFFLYSLYNLGFYSSSLIQEQFFERNIHSAIPVQLNDVFFSTHATLVTLVTIFQCTIYERGTQRVSMGARFLMLTYFLYLSGVLGFVMFHTLEWIDFLNQCSHVKLTITLVKYIPQAFMNFQRKSTSGWSIGNVLLDFTGGTFSILQMVVLAINLDDWDGFLIDTTKLGLGLFSVAFDILFIVQHYLLYRNCSDIYDLGGSL
uniref:Cystinosin homolog n=1 Tax=Cacopsylla melanoneura TaxID=428564 RepID=A0A8D8TBQ2_9HEMI